MPVTFKPNVKKVLLATIFKIFGSLVGIIVLLLILHFTVGLDTFTQIPASLGITIQIDMTYLMLWILGIILIVSAVILLSTYTSIYNTYYEFYDNRFEYTKTNLAVFSNTKDISFENISKVTLGEQGFFDGIFNTGPVVIELAGLMEKEVSFNYMDDPLMVAQKIREIIRSWQLKKQAQYTEKHKIDGILERGGF